jgi:hypothetical protein
MLETLRRKTIDPASGKEYLTSLLVTIPVAALSSYNHYIAYVIILFCGFSITWKIWQIRKTYE